jgi:hypothetical protein
MDEREGVLAELEALRGRAVDDLKSRLAAATTQMREVVTRAVAEIEGALPAEHERWLPLAQVRERLATLTRPAAPAAPAGIGLEAIRRLDAGRAQSEVLQELLEQLGPWCGGRAIVVFREGQVAGWSGLGPGVADSVRSWRGAIADSPAFSHASSGAPVLAAAAGDPVLARWLGSSAGDVLIVPMTVRGNVVGALVGLGQGAEFDVPTVQAMTFLAMLLLETLAQRAAAPAAALREPERMTAAPPPAAAPSSQMPEPAPLVVTPPAGVRVPAPAPRPAPPAAAPPAAAGGPETAAADTIHIKVPPVMPAPAPAARPAEEDKRFEEARRFARLLVSEIRLYNEATVQEAKLTRDLYRRLKDDIDRSREMYEHRIPAEVRAVTDFFNDELVRILADGDRAALGI